jgi:predicted amidophosphoribosyltransferase
VLPACGRCRRGLSPFAAGASIGPYEGTLRVAIHELKYGGRRRVAARLAERLSTTRGVRACSRRVP